MAFIPIDAKADIEGSKKGKLTPAQHAQLNAWCLASKTGILDCLDKCEAEFSSYTATDNKATVVFKKGYIVICGRLVECEAGTKVEVITPVSGEISGKIILRYSLSAVKEDEFVVETKVGSLIQQDLNDNPLTGVYEFELYSYKATPTTVTLTRTNTDYVPDIGGKLSQFEKSLTDEGKPLGGYDTSKGTIEERLTALGFNEVPTTFNFGMAVGTVKYNTGSIKQEGKFCEINIDYGTDAVSGYGHDYIVNVTANSTRQISTVFEKPENIPSGLNIDGEISCVVNGSSQGGYGVGNIKFPYNLTTTETEIKVTITIATPTGFSYFVQRINDRIVFSWSKNIVLP